MNRMEIKCEWDKWLCFWVMSEIRLSNIGYWHLLKFTQGDNFFNRKFPHYFFLLKILNKKLLRPFLASTKRQRKSRLASTRCYLKLFLSSASHFCFLSHSRALCSHIHISSSFSTLSAHFSFFFKKSVCV
jgi:hypothetical protein